MEDKGGIDEKDGRVDDSAKKTWYDRWVNASVNSPNKCDRGSNHIHQVRTSIDMGS